MYLPALIGGMLIGVSACILMLFNGRVAGISSFVQKLLSKRPSQETFNSALFLTGLIIGALALYYLDGQRITPPESNPVLIIVSGLLVGFGTSLGSGCTSGHGICGLSRLSLRSLTATLCFMASGIATVYIVRHML